MTDRVKETCARPLLEKNHETSSFVPSAFAAPSPRPAPSAAPPAATAPSFFDDYEPRGMGDLERQADDIIANFRARHQTGLDRVMSRY